MVSPQRASSWGWSPGGLSHNSRVATFTLNQTSGEERGSRLSSITNELECSLACLHNAIAMKTPAHQGPESLCVGGGAPRKNGELWATYSTSPTISCPLHLPHLAVLSCILNNKLATISKLFS